MCHFWALEKHIVLRKSGSVLKMCTRKWMTEGERKIRGLATLCFILIGKNCVNQIRFFCCNITQMSHNVDS